MSARAHAKERGEEENKEGKGKKGEAETRREGA
jgi:hypothetical protein